MEQHNDPYYIPFTEDRVSGSSEDFGLYFCSTDAFSLRNLKAGTLQESKSVCSKLWTPDLCQNRTLDAEWSKLAQKLMDLVMYEDQTVSDWKEAYLTATSTITGSFRKAIELIIIASEEKPMCIKFFMT